MTSLPLPKLEEAYIVLTIYRGLIDVVNDWLPEEMAAFENGISESFNRAILEPRHKPIITMLEEIREWLVIPNGFQELEVRKDDQSYGVNLQHKVTCKADPTPKPPAEKKPPGRNKQSAVGYCASRGRGRGRGGSENEASVSGLSGIDEASGGGRRGTRGRGRSGRGMESSVGGEEVVVELDEEAFRECMEEQAREQAKNDVEQESIHSQPTQQSGVWVKDAIDVTTEYVDEFPEMETSETTNVAEGIGTAMEEKLPAPVVDKGKGVASVAQ
ncbi:hypothetical protein Tco_0455772 [Tanacetum coccineum]